MFSTMKLIKEQERIMSDLTSMDFSDNALISRNEFLVDILDSMDVCIFVKDNDNNFLYVNETLADIIGTNKHGLIGRNISDLFEDTPQTRQYFINDMEVLHTDRPKLKIKETLAGKTFLTSKYPINLINGERGILGVSIDITETLA